MKKVFLIVVDIIFLVCLFICMFYDLFLGVDNHDAYYLVFVIIDYEILKLVIADLKYDIDND